MKYENSYRTEYSVLEGITGYAATRYRKIDIGVNSTNFADQYLYITTNMEYNEVKVIR